jgi:AraC-like DNA-binding protein
MLPKSTLIIITQIIPQYHLNCQLGKSTICGNILVEFFYVLWYITGMQLKISKLQLPIIDRIGEFPLMNPSFEFTYCNPTDSIHLYDYDASVKIDSEEFRVRPGDITCIKSGSTYGFSSDKPGKHWCAHFNDTPMQEDLSVEIPIYSPLGVNSLFFREQFKYISSLFNNLGTNKATDIMSLEARYRLKALLLSISVPSNLVRKNKRSNSSFDWEQLLSWIDERLDEPISTVLLAEQANIAPNTLSQKFKKQYETTISGYILHRRIDKAKSLLTATTLTIYEIGRSVGIGDPQYFNKQFHKITGMSPSRYRDENQRYLNSITSKLATKDGKWNS